MLRKPVPLAFDVETRGFRVRPNPVERLGVARPGSKLGLCLQGCGSILAFQHFAALRHVHPSRESRLSDNIDVAFELKSCQPTHRETVS